MSRLFDRCRVTRLGRDALLADAGVANGDPGLESVVNLNDPAAYATARGRPAPEIAVSWTGGPRGAGVHSARVRAATLGGLAHALGIGLDATGTAIVGGVPMRPERELPLERGDVVELPAGLPAGRPTAP